MTTALVWAAFIVLVMVLLAFDLGVFSKEPSKALSAREALWRTAGYAVVSVLFSVFVYFAYENHWFNLGVSEAATTETETHHTDSHLKAGIPKSGLDAAMFYLSGYLMELSLSVDNIFVIALVLGYFQVPAAYQHRVLLWGILGALLMRGVMIGLGAAIIHSAEWVMYLFGVMLIYTAFKMLFAGDDHVDLEQSRLVKIVRKIVRVHPTFDGEKFFTRADGHFAATPLFLALVVVELTDLLFAIDSIPAVFGITTDPFLVFTSNVFAILGLRSLYFAIADLLDKFRYLKYSLVVVLAFVGVKMLVHDYWKPDAWLSLGVIALALGAGVAASFVIPEPPESHEDSAEPASSALDQQPS